MEEPIRLCTNRGLFRSKQSIRLSQQKTPFRGVFCCEGRRGVDVPTCDVGRHRKSAHKVSVSPGLVWRWRVTMVIWKNT
jgi:hypothetical protein